MRIELKINGETIDRFDVSALPSRGDFVLCKAGRCEVRDVVHNLQTGRVDIECERATPPQERQQARRRGAPQPEESAA